MRTLFIIGMMLLTACGTTSKIQPASSSSPAEAKQAKTTEAPAFDIGKYDRMVVQDFSDAVSIQIKSERKRNKKQTEVQPVLKDFADAIAEEIKAKGNFLEVVRNGVSDDRTLIIGGQITRYEEGNAALKFVIGFGAGSTHFDALVEFRNGSTGQLLATVAVDKNSWALGGALATTQTTEAFIDGASKKIADQLYQLRPYAPPPRAVAATEAVQTGTGPVTSSTTTNAPSTTGQTASAGAGQPTNATPINSSSGWVPAQ